MTNQKNVLFVCVENAARSQMAEGFLKTMAPHIKVQSAGTKPSACINPNVIKVMQEIDIDIANNTPKEIKEDITQTKDVIVVNMGCIDTDSCPAILLTKQHNIINWDIDDPKDKSIEQVRKIRDTIRGKVIDMINELKGTDEKEEFHE